MAHVQKKKKKIFLEVRDCPTERDLHLLPLADKKEKRVWQIKSHAWIITGRDTETGNQKKAGDNNSNHLLCALCSQLEFFTVVL